MSNAALLITSSPAFLSEYFEPRQFTQRALPVFVIENKPLVVDAPHPSPKPIDLAPGPPWRVGWFGVIRCLKSLEVLSSLAQRRPDLVEVSIRGRPSAPVARRLQQCLRSAPALTFGGAYTARDLPGLYGGVHFNWTIDYYEENGNSKWLLPNRIYEGGSADRHARPCEPASAAPLQKGAPRD